jgi:hypothetical protein
MPIPDSELAQSFHAHIYRAATDSVYAALQAWRTTPGSRAWWWLVIEHDMQLYTAIRFSELYSLLKPVDAPVHMNTPLAELPHWRKNPNNPTRALPGIVTPLIVEQDGISMAQAQESVQESPENIVVVLRNKLFRGILTSGEHPFGFTDEPILDLLDQWESGGDNQTIVLPRRTHPDSE